MRILLLALFSIFLCFPLLAQKKNAAYQLPIKAATSEIKIDGILDEVAWQEAAVAKDFFMMLPMDTRFAQVPT